jgi:hypothetical protein
MGWQVKQQKAVEGMRSLGDGERLIDDDASPLPTGQRTAHQPGTRLLTHPVLYAKRRSMSSLLVAVATGRVGSLVLLATCTHP